MDEAIKQVFQDKPKDELKIIDVGAGTGLIGVELHKLGYTDLHALDISQEMLNEAKKKNVYKRYICAALSDQRIPEVETEEFHALICGGTLITAHIRPSALEEMVRMVKIGKAVFRQTISSNCTKIFGERLIFIAHVRWHSWGFREFWSKLS